MKSRVKANHSTPSFGIRGYNELEICYTPPVGKGRTKACKTLKGMCHLSLVRYPSRFYYMNQNGEVMPAGISIETRRMIEGEEGAIVEYKRTVDAVEQEDIVALANAKGGTILIGVDERRNHGRQYGEIVGCDVGEEARRRLLNKAASCSPPINLHFSLEKSGKTAILRVDVDEASKKPCCTPAGTYKIRKNGTKVAIDPQLMTSIIMERESQEFLARFKAAADTIIKELEGARKSLEAKIDDAISAAEAATSAAEEATSAAEEAKSVASEAADAARDASSAAEDAATAASIE